MSRRDGLVRAALHLFGNVAPMATGLVTAPMTARSLGVEDRGLLVVAALAGAILTMVGALGLGWVARAEVAADPASAAYWDGAGRMIGVFLAPIMSVLGWGGAALLGLSLVERVAAGLWMGTCALGASRSIRGNILIAMGYPDRVGVAQTWLSGSTIATMSLLYFFGALNLASGVFALTASLILQNVMLRRTWLRVGPKIGVRVSHRPSIRVLWRKGRVAWGMQAVDGLSSKADSLVFLSGGDNYRFGLYSVAAIIPQVCFQVFLTIVQRSYAKNPRLSMDRRTRALVVVCATVAVPIAALGWIAGEILITPIFGPDFAEATQFLAPAAAFSVALGTLAPILVDASIRRGRHLLVGPAFLGMVGLAAVSGLFIPPQAAVFGISGAVLIMALCYLSTIRAPAGRGVTLSGSFRQVLVSEPLVEK